MKKKMWRCRICKSTQEYNAQNPICKKCGINLSKGPGEVFFVEESELRPTANNAGKPTAMLIMLVVLAVLIALSVVALIALKPWKQAAPTPQGTTPAATFPNDAPTSPTTGTPTQAPTQEPTEPPTEAPPTQPTPPLTDQVVVPDFATYMAGTFWVEEVERRLTVNDTGEVSYWKTFGIKKEYLPMLRDYLGLMEQYDLRQIDHPFSRVENPIESYAFRHPNTTVPTCYQGGAHYYVVISAHEDDGYLVDILRKKEITWDYVSPDN